MDSVSTGSRASKKKGEKKSGRFSIKLIVSILLVASLVGVSIFEAITGKIGIKSFFKNMFDSNSNEINDQQIEEIVEMLPLDKDGVISITYPMVDRTNYDSMPQGFEAFYVDEKNNLCKADLSLVSEENSNSSVVDYNKDSNNPDIGYLGIANNYAYYLETVKDIKAKIAARDDSVTAALIPIEYEVKDLYLLPAEYQLYCDDPSLFNQAKVADEHEDGSIVYYIPARYIDKFVGVSKQVCNIIVEYDTLNAQMIDRYMYYFGNADNYGVANEPQNNMGR